MIFKRHPIYCVIHITLGFLGYFYPEVLYGTIGYQLFQYLMDIRLFAFEMKIESGNSVEHTAIKLGEVGFGYALATLYKALSKA